MRGGAGGEEGEVRRRLRLRGMRHHHPRSQADHGEVGGGKLIRNAPKCVCGTTLELGWDGVKLVWVCPRCYPKFPNRSKPPLHCPQCGEPFEGNEFLCKKCGDSFTPRPWDILVRLPDQNIGFYRELADEDIWYWIKENVKLDPWRGVRRSKSP